MRFFEPTETPSNAVRLFVKKYLTHEKDIFKATRDGKGSFLADYRRGYFNMGNGIIMRVSAPRLAHAEYTPFTCSYYCVKEKALVEDPRLVLHTDDDMQTYMARGVNLNRLFAHMRDVMTKPSLRSTTPYPKAHYFPALPFANIAVRRLEDKAPEVGGVIPTIDAANRHAGRIAMVEKDYAKAIRDDVRNTSNEDVKMGAALKCGLI